MDMMEILGKMKEVQSKLKEAQNNLQHITASGESGGGMISATVNGKKEVVDLVIDKELLNPAESDMLKDLLIAAINKALEAVDEKAKEEMKKQTQGFMPNIPGFDFGNM